MKEIIEMLSWEERELKCKTKLYYLPRKEPPLLTILILNKEGSSSDPPGKEGLSRLLFKTMITGANGMDFMSIFSELEKIGASLDVYTSRDFSTIKLDLLSKYSIRGIEILSNIILNPSFDEKEIEREKEKALNLIKDEKSDPSLIASKKFFELIFKNTFYAHAPIGYPESIKKIARDEIVKFHRDSFNSQNSFIVAVGYLNDKIIEKIDEFFYPWESGPVKGSYPEIRTKNIQKFLIINDPDSTQTQIRIGRFSPLKRTAREFIPAFVGNAILGNLFTSRLTNKIRSELGLSYSINSSIHSFKYGGLFVISTFTKNESVFETIKAIKKEIENFTGGGISEEELRRVKKFIKGRFPSSLQTNSDIAKKIAEIEFYGLPKDYLRSFLKRVEELRKDEVDEASKKHLSIENFSILCLGKAEEVEKNLTLLGKFDIKELKDV
ncbi:MAG: M16 family metallopeptidase [Candidatus Aminicenantia bacterium]